MRQSAKETKKMNEKELLKYIKEKLGMKFMTSKIEFQVKGYRLHDHIPYDDIKKCIDYWVDVKNGDTSEEYLWEMGLLQIMDNLFKAKKYYEEEARLLAQKPKEDEQKVEVSIIYYTPRMYQPKDKTIDLNNL